MGKTQSTIFFSYFSGEVDLLAALITDETIGVEKVDGMCKNRPLTAGMSDKYINDEAYTIYSSASLSGHADTIFMGRYSQPITNMGA
jgi:hypothetical protein